MAHTISERRMRERIRELAPDAVREYRRRARHEVLHARRIVALWNKRAERGLRQSYFPTIETVLAAQMPILDVLCPACQTVGSVDIRRMKRHPGMAISGLIPSLSCRMCCPTPPVCKADRIASGGAAVVSTQIKVTMKLPRVIKDKSGNTLRTTDEAKRYVLKKLKTRPGYQSWKHAGELLVEGVTAERGQHRLEQLIMLRYLPLAGGYSRHYPRWQSLSWAPIISAPSKNCT